MIPLLVNPNRRILVIDDNSAIHADFRKILGEPEAADAELDAFERNIFGTHESAWFEIDTASQGDEGLGKVEQSLVEGRPYALAFVDVRMPPGWDGIETARRIWEVDPYLQIVICTAYSDYSWEQMQTQATPGDRMLILKKPFDAIEVQQLADALSEKWRLARESQHIRNNLDRLVEQRTEELQISQASALASMKEAVHHRETAEKTFAELQVEMAKHLELKEKYQEQASLLDKARDAILVRDMDHRITYWNKSAESLYGWTAEDAHGQLIGPFLHEDPACYAEANASVLKNEEWMGEISQQTRDGRDILVESRWTLVRDAAGDAKSVMAINTDITEKKRLAAHFLRSQRIESIGTLAGGIAHDLNNVLQPIMMSIDLLRLSVHDKEQLGILSTIEGSARRGADMVRQVLSFARGIEGERLEIDLKSLINDIRHFIQETFPKNIQFSTDMSDVPSGFLGDATQIYQVLLNLCVNARDAMPDGGRLNLAVETMTVDETCARAGPDIKRGSYLVLKVGDSGTGIPDAVRNKIFDLFFTTKELGKGTGLGLSTVMAIVKSHGGFVSFDSELGNGSTFYAHFPLATAAAGTAAGSSPAQPDTGNRSRGHGRLVLLVDDEENVRSITRQTLEAFGYRVLTASNGAEAVSLYEEHQQAIAVVLTDMMMPVMDGAAAIQTLKRLNPQVKIVAASGLNSDAGKASAIGASQYLHKPYNIVTLLNTLEQVASEAP